MSIQRNRKWTDNLIFNDTCRSVKLHAKIYEHLITRREESFFVLFHVWFLILIMHLRYGKPERWTHRNPQSMHVYYFLSICPKYTENIILELPIHCFALHVYNWTCNVLFRVHFFQVTSLSIPGPSTTRLLPIIKCIVIIVASCGILYILYRGQHDINANRVGYVSSAAAAIITIILNMLR